MIHDYDPMKSDGDVSSPGHQRIGVKGQVTTIATRLDRKGIDQYLDGFNGSMMTIAILLKLKDVYQYS